MKKSLDGLKNPLKIKRIEPVKLKIDRSINGNKQIIVSEEMENKAGKTFEKNAKMSSV